MKLQNLNLKQLHLFISTPQGVTILFLFVSAFAFTLLYRSSTLSQFKGQPLSTSYLTLLKSVNEGGYSKFQQDKSELKKYISTILNDPRNEDEETHASNIALYFFPELLSDSNFEKSAALELWAPFEIAIEKSPRTPEARMLFEIMKSNIWNYENPKMKNAGLSPHAQETLKVYHELSSP